MTICIVSSCESLSSFVFFHLFTLYSFFLCSPVCLAIPVSFTLPVHQLNHVHRFNCTPVCLTALPYTYRSHIHPYITHTLTTAAYSVDIHSSYSFHTRIYLLSICTVTYSHTAMAIYLRSRF